jgi:rare lipoprotein A
MTTMEIRRRPRARDLPSAIVLSVLLVAWACAPATTGAVAPDAGRAPASLAPGLVPAVAAGWSEQGEASWYGPGFAGRPTANGEVFDPRELTAAHPTLPFGTRVEVRNLETGRTVVVRINDRGPFVPGRIIDLSQAAAEAIGLIATGVAPVRITLAGGPEGLRPLRVDPSLSGYDVIVPGATPGTLVVLRSASGADVLTRVVASEPPAGSGSDGFDVWTSAGLADRLGAVASVALD